MALRITPATAARFEDIAAVLAPKKAGAQGCWCLSHRLTPQENDALRAPAREEALRDVCRTRPAPGVLAYDGPEVAGWASIAPRSHFAALKSERFPAPEGAWALTCFRVRAGHTGQGVARALLDGAVAHARTHKAAAVVGYPVEAKAGQRIDRTQAAVGLLEWFTDLGFAVTADTGYHVNECRRVVATLEL